MDATARAVLLLCIISCLRAVIKPQQPGFGLVQAFSSAPMQRTRPGRSSNGNAVPSSRHRDALRSSQRGFNTVPVVHSTVYAGTPLPSSVDMQLPSQPPLRSPQSPQPMSIRSAAKAVLSSLLAAGLLSGVIVPPAEATFNSEQAAVAETWVSSVGV